MAIVYQNQVQRRVYYQMSTANKSFLEMHYFLKDKGLKNNKFMLVLIDRDLAGVDPYDKNLSTLMKQKVLRECMSNYWYFIREVVRIPDQGGTGPGKRYQLNRGNLAMNFCMMLNLNTFLELPRQIGKTVGALIRYLWVFLFGTSNSEIAFLHKKMEESKLNLSRIKEIREALPSYLRMDQTYSSDGKKVKPVNRIETIQHPLNMNKIRAVPSARNRIAAASLLRGRTLPMIYADEYAFIPYNDIIFNSTMPAFKTAMMNAKKNNAPYGWLITTTPGYLHTDEGKEAFDLKNAATPFCEEWYDKTYEELMEIINTNLNSNFVYIKFSYQQLGRDEKWFRELCIEMRRKWPDIRREVLLEWSQATENSPFRKEDLEIVKSLTRQPIKTILLMGKYQFNIYEQLNLRYPPLIGVDVSGGFSRDSSAITVVDSNTTRVTADMNCNYISPIDLAQVVYEIVTRYMPNAVVNVERNGGYGASVLAKLVNSSIKRNLYYEIKDKVIEERFMGQKTVRKTQKTKIYGLDSTKDVRELLIEILRNRIEYHKDKVVSPIICEELYGMEVKKNGKVEHSTNTHDDQVFSWLMALYVYYEGQNLMESFGIEKKTLKTDQDLEEAVLTIDEKYADIIEEIEMVEDETVSEQMEQIDSVKAIQYEEWMQQEFAKDQAAMQKILATKVGREAYIRQFNADPETLTESKLFSIPASVFSDFYADDSGGNDDEF